MVTLLGIIAYLLNIYAWIVIAQAILSTLVAFNVVNTYNDFVRQVLTVLDRLTEPVYRPIRRILPDLGAIDLSPWAVLILINILTRFVIPALQQQLLLS